jgi:hypothetical protein
MLPLDEAWDEAGPSDDAAPGGRRPGWWRVPAGFLGLILAAIVIVVVVRAAWPEDTGPNLAQGERILHEVTLPAGWRRDPVGFENPWFMSQTFWAESIMADVEDLDQVADVVNRAIKGEGWTGQGCAEAADSSLINCSWVRGGYRLSVLVEGFDPLLKAPCPTGMTQCARVSLHLALSD